MVIEFYSNASKAAHEQMFTGAGVAQPFVLLGSP